VKILDLLKDKLMGIYIDALKEGREIKSVYKGIEENAFIIETEEDLKIGEKVILRLSFGGWNFLFTCVVKDKSDKEYRLISEGKVKIVEKRREKRIPVVIKCSLEGDVGTVLDISRHGIRVLTLRRLAIKDKTALLINGNIVSGIVRWIKKEEFDLISAGIAIEDPPKWWVGFVDSNLSDYMKSLRRL
jgi:hypothetical protein